MDNLIIEIKKELTMEKKQLWLNKAVRIKKQLINGLGKGEITINEIVSTLASCGAYGNVYETKDITSKKIDIQRGILLVE